jgi:cell division septation protein DedD
VTQTPDTAEDGFHEIQLSGKQLVFLFMATTVVSVVIFLCGVLVGRGVRSGSELDRPTDTAAVDQTPAAPDTSVPPTAEGAAPPQPISEAELSYHDRLQQEKPKEQLKPPTPEPAPAPAPQQPAAAKPVQPPPASAPAATSARSGADVPTTGRPGSWVIQVHALRNREAASSIVQRLIAKGYPAFLPAPPAGQPAIYRVQIGKYRDRAEADQVARRLAKEEQLRPEVKR